MANTYYLFGEHACDVFNGYQDKEGNILRGAEALIQAHEDNECNFATFCFIEGVTTPTMLLENYQGWNDYTIITKEEFDLLNK